MTGRARRGAARSSRMAIAAHALLHLSVAAAAFQASPPRPHVPMCSGAAAVVRSAQAFTVSTEPTTTRLASNTLRMFDGPPPPEPDDEDIFAEISGELTPLQQKLRELSPLAMGATTKSLTVVSAIFAWFLTPPIGRVASLGAVVAGGYGGTRLSKNLRAQRKEVVPAVIADMVREGGFKSLDPTEVAQLADKYGVEAVEFEAQLSSVYARYLRQLLGDADEIGTKAISELSALRRGIGLKWSTTQQVHVSEVCALDGLKAASTAAAFGMRPPPPCARPTRCLLTSQPSPPPTLPRLAGHRLS